MTEQTRRGLRHHVDRRKYTTVHTFEMNKDELPLTSRLIIIMTSKQPEKWEGKHCDTHTRPAKISINKQYIKHDWSFPESIMIPEAIRTESFQMSYQPRTLSSSMVHESTDQLSPNIQMASKYQEQSPARWGESWTDGLWRWAEERLFSLTGVSLPKPVNRYGRGH